MYNIKIKNKEEEHEFDYEGIFLIGAIKDGDNIRVDFHGNIPVNQAFLMLGRSCMGELFPDNNEEIN